MSRTISAGYVYRQYSTEGVYIADYKSSRAAHEATGVSIGSIARAAHGERWTRGRLSWLPILLIKSISILSFGESASTFLQT